MTAASSLAPTLHFILHGSGQADNENVVVLDYRDPETFEALWLKGLKSDKITIGKQSKIDLTSATKQILIIGNDPPNEIFDTKIPALAGINFRDHFTATSWLVARNLKFQSPGSPIAIIDPQQREEHPPIVKTLQTVFDSVGADPKGQSSGSRILNSPSLREIVLALAGNRNQERKFGATFVPILRAILWESLIADAENHHSISNILGAAFLSEPETVHNEMLYLRSLFSCLTEGVPDFRTTDFPVGTRNTNLPDNTNFVLFDDMAELWRKPLEHLIQASGVKNYKIHQPYVGTSESCALAVLAEKLKEFTQDPYQKRFLTLKDFGIEGEDANQSDFVLFLDLRLFGSSDNPTDAESSLFQRLLQTHVSVRSSSESESALSKLPWPPLEADGAEDPKWLAPLTDGEFSGGYRKMRALLPKLISLIDPTLPIVLFSSTQDAEVLRELSGHGNIVTRFSKPVFRSAIGDANEWTRKLISSFSDSLAEAGGILMARKSFLEIREKVPIPANHGNNQPFEPTPTSVEIFLDESGKADSNHFGIGGIVVISNRKGGFHHFGFAQALKQQSGLWGVSGESKEFRHQSCKTFPRKFAAKGSGLPEDPEALNQEFDRVANLVSGAGGELYGFLLLETRKSEDNLFSKNHPHNRYREMMREILEILLYEFEPVSAALKAGSSLSIDAAQWSPMWQSGWGDRKAATDKLGIEFHKNGESDRYTGFRQTDLFPILADMIHRMGLPCNDFNQIKRARSVQLVDFGRTDDLQHALTKVRVCPPYQIHYLADWIVHLLTQRNISPNPNLSPLIEDRNVMTCVFSPEFKHRRQGVRHWQQGNVIEALQRIRRSFARDPDSSNFEPNNLTNWVQEISGPQLTEVFASKRGKS